jgi:tetratricopeptide (TPR) repeat protein
MIRTLLNFPLRTRINLGVSLVVIPLFVSIALWRGDLGALVLLIAVFIILVFFAKWRFGDRRNRQLLQSPSADELVVYYRKMIRIDLMPDGDAWLAYLSAQAYTFYGNYDDARKVFQSIDWTQRTDLIQASGWLQEALLCYLDTKEYERGLELSRSVQELRTASKASPRAEKEAAARQLYVELGEVLCNRSTEATVASIEKKMRTSPAFMKLLAAWGLMIAYRKSGDQSKADAMQKYLHETAPYCRAFTLPPNVEAAPV